jgi:membrane protein
MTGLERRLRDVYRRLNAYSGGTLDILHRAILHFGRARASEAAASMAYYALFSLFPLALVLVSATGFFLESGAAYVQVLAFMSEVIPVSRGLIERNVSQVLEQRRAIGLVGLAGLLWSASGVFTTLVRNISRAWPETELRSVVEQRLVGLVIVGLLVLLLILSLVFTTVLDFLPSLTTPLGDRFSLFKTPLWTFLSNILPWLFAFLIFLALYRWVPNRRVPWSAAFWGALIAALAWEIASSLFTWYLGSGLIQYELVYGSLGAVVVLLVWIYITSWITLFGAHLSAAVGHEVREEQEKIE